MSGRTVLTRSGRRPAVPQAASALERLARRAVLRRLEGLQHGELLLEEGGRTLRLGQPSTAHPRPVRLRVHDPRFWGEVAFGGSVGAGEAYMAGWWTSDALTDLIRLMARNLENVDRMESGSALLSGVVRRALHALRRNSIRGSRRNIATHYDLGNAFFELFLDERLMYSSAIFPRAAMSLDEAAQAKLERVCRKLNLKPEDEVLEIGSGWGGFAIHAASRFGCRVTTATISREQHAEARRRVAAAGLEAQVTVLFEDYRNLSGRYDKLVSIEMIEAVGHQWLDSFFRQCSALLKDDGAMLLQAITIADQRYDSAKRSVDFIQRYIFPGGALPSVAVMCSALARVTDMRLLQLEDIGPHYAETLRHWRARFLARLDDVRAQGYSERFIRMWEYYLCYCEAGFEERRTGTVQMLLAKPGNRSIPATTRR